jgi:BirA family transcriptional regulator, biotin operon repressor / biotin---[acetyl-CoA-carboxylase] ligase
MLNTFMFGKVCHRFEELASTNTFASELVAKENPPAGTAILAANQTAGRGQFGRQWHSIANTSLTVSFVCYPSHLTIADLPVLSKSIALATRATLATFLTHDSVNVKWPNDVYVQDKKIAGILIENSITSAGCIQNSIIGIGINVNQMEFEPDLNAISLATLCEGKKMEIEHVFQVLCQQLDHYYALTKGQDRAAIEQEYHHYLYLQGQKVSFLNLANQSNHIQTIHSVDSNGNLITLDTDNNLHEWPHGTIALKI